MGDYVIWRDCGYVDDSIGMFEVVTPEERASDSGLKLRIGESISTTIQQLDSFRAGDAFSRAMFRDVTSRAIELLEILEEIK